MRALLVFSLIIPLQLASQDFQATLADIQSENNIVGMAVEVYCGGEEVASYYGGLKNIGLQLPLNTESYFRIASISKSFTAAGLMKALENSDQSLDDDISEVLGYTLRNPQFPDAIISYRMLLSHTSSLQDGSGYSPFLTATYEWDEIPNISEVLIPEGEYYTTNMWRTEVPGTFFAYSNINYGLIGTLIEKLSEQRFDIYMKNEILEPLDIQGSFNVNDIPDINDLSVLYRDGNAQWDDFGGNYPPPFDEEYLPGTNGSLFAPQGGLRCRAKDLIKFGLMLLNDGSYEGQQILETGSVDAMMGEQWDYNGSNGDDYFGLFRNWGLGLHRAQGELGFDKVFENRLMPGHPGEAYGLISDLYVDPEADLILVFISNGYSSGGSYSFAENSIFYAPEEQTFEAIESVFLSTCQTLSTDELSDNRNVCGEISNGKISSDFATHIQVLKSDGMTVAEGKEQINISSLSQG
ncbi:MAG: serine hydrolase domain-containing protein, partial [Cryomorphaceae bacterium]